MTLESEVHEAMVNIYIRARKDCNYNATRFLQMLDQLVWLRPIDYLLRTRRNMDSPSSGS